MLIDAKDRLFKRAPAPFGARSTPDPDGAKEAFINLNYAQYLLFFGYPGSGLINCKNEESLPGLQVWRIRESGG